MNPFFPPYFSILVDLTDGNLQFPDSEDEVHNKDNACDYGDNPEGDASLRVLVIVPLAVAGRVEVDSQCPSSDHQHCANKGRHHLEEVGHQVSDKGGEGEHQEDHQETHAPPDAREVGINTTKSELTALVANPGHDEDNQDKEDLDDPDDARQGAEEIAASPGIPPGQEP